MANGFTRDIAGDIERGLQFRQQAKLRPLQLEAQQLALQQQQQALAAQPQQLAQQFKLGQLKQQNLESQIAARTEEQKNKSLVNAALQVTQLPDEQVIPFLEKRLREAPQGADMAETQQALQQARAGDIQGVKQGAQNVVDVGVRQGIIPKGPTKTASQKDFETFKQLSERARATGDPIDIQLAEQFGVQSGFDRLSPQELADIDVQKTSRIELVKQAAKASKEAFDNLKGVRKTVANMDDAIKALDKGAATGPIISKLPSFRESSIELNNIRGRMGLDVVGATTFGALSESELAFALDTALPDSLQPEALKDWLNRKRDAQTKLADELRKAASFLGTPGNTIADYIKKQEEENKAADVTQLSDEDLFN